MSVLLEILCSFRSFYLHCSPTHCKWGEVGQHTGHCILPWAEHGDRGPGAVVATSVTININISAAPSINYLVSAAFQ